MKCPKCENKMEVGFIPVGKQILQWTPKGIKRACLFNGIAKGAVPLTPAPTLFKFHDAESYYCQHCKFVIIPVKDKLKD